MATMICIDNSEWMKNGDYAPNRFQAQADAVNLICGAKTQMSLQDGTKDSSSQSKMTKLLEDQSFVSSILSSLPGVDPNDPSMKELLASMKGDLQLRFEDVGMMMTRTAGVSLTGGDVG